MLAAPGRDFPDDWSSDGKCIIFQRNNPEMGFADLWYVQRDEETGNWEPNILRQTRFRELRGSFSPDGRYYAYLSNETGQDEIIVREFPDGKDRWIVSEGKADRPRWTRRPAVSLC